MKKIIFNTLFFFFLLILSNYVFASTQGCTSNTSCTLDDPLDGKKFSNLVTDFTNFLITIGSFVLPIMVLYGGYLILSAGDKIEQVTKGRNVILWAVVGFIIILIASGVKFIVEDVLGIKSS